MTSTLGGASVASLVGGSVASGVGVSVGGGAVASGVADSAGVDGASVASDPGVAAGDSAGPDDSGPPDAGADSAGVVAGACDSTGCPEVSGPELAAAVPRVGLGVAVGVASGSRRRRVPVLQREDVDRVRLGALLHDDDLAAVGRHDRVELPLRADVAERGDVAPWSGGRRSLPRPGTAG